MFEFTWHMTISFLLLFFILSSSIFFYTKEKSYKYYALYNLFLVLYILTKKASIYVPLHDFVTMKFGSESTDNILSIGNWYIQTIFYSFYALFCMSFVDLEVHVNGLFRLSKTFLAILIVVSTGLMVYGLWTFNFLIYYRFFLYIFVPLILCLFFFLLPIALKYSGKHKYYLVTGSLFYIALALFALLARDFSDPFFYDPVTYFFIGIIIESIFFTIGIAYKIKTINDEKNNHQNEMIIQKHNYEISKFESFIQGEEKERLRIAKELHDGVNGDLSAIKFKLSPLLDIDNPAINDAVEMIDKSCQQIRTISHNLVPPSLHDFNLVEALEEYCTTMSTIHHLQISFQNIGEEIILNKKVEINIFRVVQELITNSVKHAKADEIGVQISSRNEVLQVTVEDNGKGYDKDTVNTVGIGLKNIQARIDYLNATLDIISNAQGTSTTIELDINKTK